MLIESNPLHIGDRVLVLFAIAGVATDPYDQRARHGDRVAARHVWKERRLLGFDIKQKTVRVLDFHLEPVDVPMDWIREVPT